MGLSVNNNDMDNLVLVEGGSFLMGNTRGDLEGWIDETPLHTVTLIYDYWIEKCEVTFDDYDAYTEDMRKRQKSDEGWGRGTRPVINVSWMDAIEYCNWLSEKDGYAKAYDDEGNLLDEYGKTTTDIKKVIGCRLPTEAEWEYAARGGHKASKDWKYSGSDDVDKVAWYWKNSGNKILTGPDSKFHLDILKANQNKTHKVGSKPTNELGLYNMSGNVCEWCHDWYAGYSGGTQRNPIGPDGGSGRVVRGGSWYDGAQYCRVAFRRGNKPDFSVDGIGFRCVWTNL